jgi:dTDP-4-amino-4,6-dideoxygalactose transaminase
MTEKFFKPIADASQFPIPLVSATPKFKFSALNLVKSFQGKVNEAIFTRNGRGAIGIAGTALKNENNNVILIPAYHCPALVEPFIWLGYKIRFYPVNPDLSIDIEILSQLLTEEVTHCVVVRYFGFGLNNDDVIHFLQGQSVKIIEDCAHSLFRFSDHFKIGSQKPPIVDASICSINKILPTIDGGGLYLREPFQANLCHVGWEEEAKACAFLLGVPQLLAKIKRRLRSKKAEVSTPIPLVAEQDDAHLRYFQPIDLKSASYRHTKMIFRHSDLEKIKSIRRSNFEYLTKNLNNPEIGEVLFKQLADDDVPYVIPLLLTDEKHFVSLRKRGIQILRWEEVAASDCEVSQRYRSTLIQIPCHQQLSQQQMDLIVNTFNKLSA